jgi:hypothetical protein
MSLSNPQLVLLEALQRTTESRSTRTVRYVSEWLGYLPFGVYHWLERGGEDISASLPSGWSLEDLQALAGAGKLELLEDWRDPEDEFGRKVTYRVA